MKVYKVASQHNVYIDNFENGEERHVNSYMLSSEIEAENWKSAIQQYFNEFLCFDFDIEYSHKDEEENILHYSNLVDVDNTEATQRQISLWKENKLTLYANHSMLTVEQLIEEELV